MIKDQKKFNQLYQWFECESGQKLLENERAMCRRYVSNISYWNFLEYSYYPLLPHTVHGEVWRGMQLCPDRHKIVTETNALIPSQSMDMMLFHHVFEVTTHRHTLIEEVERILRPGGHVLIFAFNRQSPARLAYAPHRIHYHGVRQVQWQLRSKNIQPIQMVYYGQQWLGIPQLSCGWLLVAHKQSVPLNPHPSIRHRRYAWKPSTASQCIYE